MPTLLISVAEPSGDRLAAELVAALRRREQVRVRGIAGPALRAAGVEPLARAEDLGVMGLTEVVRNLGAIARARRAMRAAIDEGAHALVVVDAPSFHLPLARRARARGIRAVGYASPQVWAWRPGRVHEIARSLDRLLCLFEFEPALYPPGFDARWTGHPVVDRLPRRDGMDPDLFGLLPGSRQQERERLLPIFLETARRVRAVRPSARFLAVVPPGVSLGDLGEIEVARDIRALSRARAALTKSGTVTLELAVMGVPQVVAHRVHPVTYWMGRMLVRGVRYLAMPNVLAGREVVPEFVQHLDAESLAQALLALPEEQPVDLRALGPSGAADRAAAAVW